jgi:WXXGXW repeat (2 copies)
VTPRAICGLVPLLVLAAGCVVEPGAPAPIYVDVSPPPSYGEEIPLPRPGFVWIPGYWNWSGTEDEWVAGHWEPDRPGYHYVEAHWERVAQGWRFTPGYWAR